MKNENAGRRNRRTCFGIRESCNTLERVRIIDHRHVKHRVSIGLENNARVAAGGPASGRYVPLLIDLRPTTQDGIARCASTDEAPLDYFERRRAWVCNPSTR